MGRSREPGSLQCLQPLALPLPRFWPRVVHRGVLHVLSLSAVAMTRPWSRAARGRVRTERLRSELALLEKELEFSVFTSRPCRKIELRLG